MTPEGWGWGLPTPRPAPHRRIGCISRGRVCTAASLWRPRPELSVQTWPPDPEPQSPPLESRSHDPLKGQAKGSAPGRGTGED